MDAVVVMTWQEATAQGLQFFYTGVPCKRGHISLRYVAGNRCVECDRERRKSSGRPSGRPPGPDAHHRDVPREGMDKDPEPWRDDGGARRVPIHDHVLKPPRLVRIVGWVNCLSPYTRNRKHRFLSPDIKRVRTCPSCKNRVVSEYHTFRAD